MSTALRLPLCLRTRFRRFVPMKYLYRSKSTATPTPTPKSDKRTYMEHIAQDLSYHWDTLPPTPTQLEHARKYFERQAPTFLWSAPMFSHIPFGVCPEVCFLGRSNVGKSTLLNSIFGQDVAYRSRRPGFTKHMNAFAVGEGTNRLVVMDMPGYGKGGRAEWGTEILKYLEHRKQLKRTFLLIDSQHGMKDTDRIILKTLKKLRVPYQVIMSKVDKVILNSTIPPKHQAIAIRFAQLRQLMEQVKEVIQPNSEDDGGAIGEIIASSEYPVGGRRTPGPKMGIDAVRYAMLRAAELEYQPKIDLSAPMEIISHEELFEMQRNKG